MLLCKLLGGGILLLCGLLFPRFAERERQEDALQTVRLIALVRFIRSNIEFYRIPVGDILAKCDRKLRDSFGGGDSLAAMVAGTEWCDARVGKIAEEFAAKLGKGYFAEQRRICDYTLTALDDLAGKKAAMAEKRRKTEKVLCLGGAAAIVILLI